MIIIIINNEKDEGKRVKKTNMSGAYLASGSRDRTIKIWEVATQQCIFTLVVFLILILLIISFYN